jgi:hypothetical protein
MRTAIDDLPSIGVSRMRAAGAFQANEATTTIRFADGLSFVVGLSRLQFPNGGGWSFFVCPCGRRARTIRLFDGSLACRSCLAERGLRPRIQLIGTHKRAAYLAPRLVARLNSPPPARLNPRPGRTLDRRAKLELALKRTLIVARGAAIEKFEKDLSKP